MVTQKLVPVEAGQLVPEATVKVVALESREVASVVTTGALVNL
jgi:hypothetical protein